jgi:hypothetical protein
MEVQVSGGGRMGEGGGFVKEQDQACALPEVRRRGASEDESPGLREELLGEVGVMEGRRARHETTPGASGAVIFSDEALSIAAASENR